MATTDTSIEMQAPGHGHTSGMHAPAPRQELPAVDDRLAPPENRIEYFEGSQVFAAPANEPHGRAHSSLAYVIRAHVADDYLSAVDMLTRTGESSDIAPDASVYPAARDPKTGGRQLEVLAFEVTSEQRLSVPTDRARRLTARGVRRVFCILVKEQRVLEWSREANNWSPLPDDYQIKDESLTHPLPVAALLHAMSADDAVVHALDAKGNPALQQLRSDSRQEGHEAGRQEGLEAGRQEGHEAGRQEGHEAGRQEGLEAGRNDGKAAAILAVLVSRNIEILPPDRARILACRDQEQLDRWLMRVATVPSAVALLMGD